MITTQELDELYESVMHAPGGESWIEINGECIATDVGYAFDGVDILYKILRERSVQNDSKEIWLVEPPTSETYHSCPPIKPEEILKGEEE